MAEQTHDLIIAEDSEVVRNLLVRLATSRGFKPVAEERGDDAMQRVHDGVKAVIIDLRMPGWDGFECLEWLAREHPDLPAVVLSGADEASEAVRAMKLGAVDYVTKPFDAEELFTVLRKAVQLRELKRENQALREEYEMPAGALSDDPVGASEVMKALFRRASQAAPLDSNILLTGESGTGKGVLARHIHARSGRAGGPFITVSCPTLPRELLESELFGHEKGAFTGAMRKRAGKIELAHGGTLFLDEIGDMPLDLQPKLLNVLQDREYQRVGGETTLKADVRVIAATHVDLRDAVKNGAFREDLYYRLGVLTLEVPPLRERDGDIRTLVEHVGPKPATDFSPPGHPDAGGTRPRGHLPAPQARGLPHRRRGARPLVRLLMARQCQAA
jgi:DNA-binding NtrC family response regulator